MTLRSQLEEHLGAILADHFGARLRLGERDELADQLAEEVVGIAAGHICDHRDRYTVLVSAGSVEGPGRYVSVWSCADCRIRLMGWVQWITGLEARSTAMAFGGRS